MFQGKIFFIDFQEFSEPQLKEISQELVEPQGLSNNF